MTIKSFFINVGKLILCTAAFYVGIMLGGTVANALGLQQPPMPEGFDASTAGLWMILESPLYALVLIGISRFIAGKLWLRTLMLFSVTWIANTVNNQIEASFFGMQASGFWFTLVVFLFPSLLMAAAVAWLFPPFDKETTFADAAKSFFSRYTTAGWAWRLAVGAVAFMPIYYFFGLLVIPFTRQYYEQGLYGLQIPPLNVLLTILFIRSVLFFVACLPILIAWQSSRWNLILFLGLALFYMVGLQAMLLANWMPWSLRLPHLLEILADEFVYAGALAFVLGVGSKSEVKVMQPKPA
jgi:hypothetical protein